MKNKQSAFSLVEVTLALGIAAFVIIALAGLSSLSLRQAHDSRRDVMWVNITQEVVSELRNTSWSNLKSLTPTSWYFDSEGLRLSSATGAYYECKIEEVNSSQSLPGAPTASKDYTAVLVIKLRWPLGAASPKESTLPLLLSQNEPVSSNP